MYPQSSRANFGLGNSALARGDTALARTHLQAALRALPGDRDPQLDPTTRQRIERQATTTLDAMLDEVIPWIRAELESLRA